MTEGHSEPSGRFGLAPSHLPELLFGRSGMYLARLPGPALFLGMAIKDRHQWWLFSCKVVSDSFVTPWTVALHALLSIGFPKQEYWSGLPFSSPGDLPNPGIKPWSPALAGILFATKPPGKPTFTGGTKKLQMTERKQGISSTGNLYTSDQSRHTYREGLNGPQNLGPNWLMRVYSWMSSVCADWVR